jgi:hypothetical protein
MQWYLLVIKQFSDNLTILATNFYGQPRQALKLTKHTLH